MLRAVFVVSSLALAVPTFTTDPALTLGAMCVFEAAVGIYWPAIGTVKSQVVPEDSRATIYNIFRVPLNGVVLAVLLNHMETSTAFSICAAMLLTCVLAQSLLFSKLSKGAGGPSVPLEPADENAQSLISASGSDKDY